MKSEIELLKEKICELESENAALSARLKESGIIDVNIDVKSSGEIRNENDFLKYRFEKEQSIAQIGDWFYDFGTGVLYWSDQIKKMLEFDLDSPTQIRRQIFNLIHPDDKNYFFEANKQLRLHGIPYSCDIRAIKPDGSINYFRAFGEPVYEAGDLVKIWGVLQDITSSKKVEENLKANEKMFRSYFELPLVGIAITDIDGKWLNVNQKLCSMVEYTKEELLSKSWMDITPKKILHDEINSYNSRIIENSHSTIFNYEKQYITKSGKIIDVNLSSIRIFNANNEIDYFISVIQDITEQKLLSVNLDENIEKYKIVADFTYDWEYWKNPELEYIYCSPSCKRITGYDVEEFKQDKDLWRKFIHPDSMEDYVNRLNWDRESIQTFEFKIITKDGEEKWILHVCNPVYNSKGEYIGVRGSNKDITELKRVTEQAIYSEQLLLQSEKMASLGVLIAGVAHEINNPNNLIMFNSDLLSKLLNELLIIIDDYAYFQNDFLIAGMPYSTIRSEIQMLSNGIGVGAGRIKDIIKDLKYFTGFENVSDYKQVDVNEIVKAASILTNSSISQATSKFHIEYSMDLPAVIGSFGQIEQVVINLIVNACQALPTQTSSLIIRTYLNDGEDYVVISVEDSGVGISDENLEKIFDPFYTTKRDIGGMGLGLAISYRIIEKHGGTLKISSKVGQGTVAAVYLPTIKNKLQEIK